MAGFCTRCGRPLPESGICPCTQQAQQPQYQQPQHQQPQQPQAPKEPSAFGLAIKGLPQLWLSYCKDPIGTTRKAVEKHDFLSGILMAAVTYIAVFFATLVNGGQKYLPAPDAYEKITYEAMNSGFAAGSHERLVEIIIAALNAA